MSACPQCGEDNPRRSRYCWACGAALPGGEAAVGEARKTVTVVFCDVKGSTALGEQLDPESHRRVIGRYFDEMRAAIERHGGTVEKFIGDAVMAVFGIPQAHEDDALRAVRAAVEMREALDRLNGHLLRSFGVELAMRTGVNTGEVVTGDASAGQTLVTGDAVVVAKRLEESAGTGEIQLGPGTYRLVRDQVEAEPVGPVPLKGKAEPVAVWRLVQVTSGPETHALRLDSPLVGRDLELASLVETFDHALADRSCHLFTVLGPAGIGKSRLTHEFIAHLEGRAAVLRGHCLPYGDGITFWPLVEIVKVAAGLTDEDEHEDAGRKIASLLPTGDESDLVCQRIAAAVGRGDAEARTEETFWAVRKLFDALAGARPLVVVFDDIQWAEDTFLDLIEYLAGWSDYPILILCLARPDLLDARPTWTIPRANATAIVIDPLIEPESDRLIRNLLGETGIDEASRVRIAAAAEGNPLFVEEMIRMLIDDDLLRREDGRWTATGDLSRVAIPPTIHALLAARLDRLHPEERAVVQRASVVGQVFWWGAVGALSSEWASAWVGGHLQALVRKELIRPERSTFAGEDAFRFSHILIRDAAYGALPKEVRADLHERLAGWLEQKAGERTDEYEEIIGYHLEQAYRYRVELGDFDAHAEGLAARAGTRLAAAGQRAVARGDNTAAASLLDRTVALLPADDPERAPLLIELADALRLAGRLEEADVRLREAAELAGPDRALAQRAELDRAFLRVYTSPSEGTDSLLRAANEAIARFEEPGEEANLAHAWLIASEIYWIRCEIGQMQRALERALRLAEGAGLREQGRIRSGLARAAMFGPTPVEEGLSLCREFVRRSEGESTILSMLALYAAYLEALRGRFAEARAQAEGALESLAGLGKRILLASHRLFPGKIELLAGDAVAAEAHFRDGYETLAELHEQGNLASLAMHLAAALHAQGRDDEADALVGEAAQVGSPDDIELQVLWRVTRARIRAAGGSAAEAEALAREAVAIAEPTDAPNIRADAQLALAAALWAQGRDAEAGAAAGRARELYEAKGNLVGAREAGDFAAARRRVSAG